MLHALGAVVKNIDDNIVQMQPLCKAAERST
jgi:hypothetical protein